MPSQARSCLWVKTNGGMGSLYRSRHELVFVFGRRDATRTNNVQLGRHGRNRTNVWNYPGMNSFARRGRTRGLDLHPTVKPLAMVSDAILDVTQRGDIVLDPFCGSGTTILAAERTGRRSCAIELDPGHVDNRNLRKLLVVGAHAVLFHRKPHTDPLRMWAKRLLEKKPFKLVAVALANKMARIAFAIMRSKTVYREIPA